MSKRYGEPAERFWLSVTDRTPGNCWLWTGSGGRGYGLFNVDGRNIAAHRFAYQLLVGPIPDGMQLDHLCRVRTCVNPEHLQPVTNRENTVRGIGPELRREALAAQTHCSKGHEYNDLNTQTFVRPSDGYVRRRCRVCDRAARRTRVGRPRVSDLTPGPGASTKPAAVPGGGCRL